jgi:uncharacterized protein (DUF488 family)
MVTVFTTGYQGFDEEGFVWKLNLHGVELVVDVRDNPMSRNRSFTQARLREFLAAAGIDYVHFKQLGAPAELRRRLRSGGSMEEYFAGYREHLAGQEEALQQVAEMVKQRRCCLLCLERRPEDCHRTVLAEVLRRRHGFEVEHI